ncbi:MAG: hypothetical protein RIR26_2446 [Pseudomonadota bacterium]
MKNLRAPSTNRCLFARPSAWRMVIFLLLPAAQVLLSVPSAQAQEEKDSNIPSGKIGKGKREIQNKSCLVPVKVRGLNEGDLAEVVDNSNARVAVVRLERLPPQTGRLVANVLVGGENCNTLRGLNVRPLAPSGASFTGLIKKPQPTPLMSVSVQYALAQNSIPGLAMNKFLTPIYTTRGIGLRASGSFPQEAKVISGGKYKALGDVHWATTETSPPLDLVKDGKVAGSQSLSSQNLRVRAGAQYISKDSKFWTNAGALLYDTLRTKTVLTSLTGASEPAFPVVRAISSKSFGVFLEQGFVMPGEARIALHGGINFGTSATTPILEDGDATNTSEKFKITGTPLLAGLHLKIPFSNFVFVEMQLDYRKVELQLPLVNEKFTKAQWENLSLATGLGVQF